MDVQLILDILKMVASVVGLGTFFYFYSTNSRFKEITNNVLKFLPGLLRIVISRTKNDPNKFDVHDMAVIVSNVVTKVQETVSDPDNLEFDDVQDEIVELLQEELQRLRDAGTPGVPDINEASIPLIVNVIFTQIKAVADEN